MDGEGENAMIVGVDGYYLTYTQRRGIGTYLQRLLEHMHEVMGADDRMIVFSPVPIPDRFERVSNVSAGRRVTRYIWEQWVLPREALRNRVDCLHSPANTRPYFSGVPVVASVHDTIMFAPDKRSPYEVYAKLCTRRSLRACGQVITDSHASRRQIEAYGPAGEVAVVYPGAPLAPLPSAARTGRTVAHFAAPDRRKNTALVLRAADHARDLEFTLMGMTKEQVESAWGIPVPANVTCLGYVSQEQKISRLSRAGVLLYVSSSEGFGLPVLEAMACGCPVITAQDPAVTEIGGPALVSIEISLDGLVAAIRRCLCDDAYRSEKIRQGYQNIVRFQWRETARQTYRIYQKAGSGR